MTPSFEFALRLIAGRRILCLCLAATLLVPAVARAQTSTGKAAPATATANGVAQAEKGGAEKAGHR